jgi:hypothetical protein
VTLLANICKPPPGEVCGPAAWWVWVIAFAPLEIALLLLFIGAVRRRLRRNRKET